MNDNKGNQITFVIFTYNEEKRIENVIRNLKDFGSILLADDGSTDSTIEIANKYGCSIYRRENFGYGYVENQSLVNRIYELVETDWIYWGFADEMLDRETLKAIKEIVSNGKYKIINIDRKNYFMGRFCYDMFHSRTNKCFTKGSIDFSENKIHGFGKELVSEEQIYILPSKYFVHHFISNNTSSYINVINRYTEEDTGYVCHTKWTLLGFSIYYFLRLFCKNYLVGRGFKAGIEGSILFMLMYFYQIIKLIKNIEAERNITQENIRYKNMDMCEKILI